MRSHSKISIVVTCSALASKSAFPCHNVSSVDVSISYVCVHIRCEVTLHFLYSVYSRFVYTDSPLVKTQRSLLGSMLVLAPLACTISQKNQVSSFFRVYFF